MSGLVRLVGAGPGPPGLLTLQAAEAIRDADAVRHNGADPAVLALARPGADVARFDSASEVADLARAGRRVAVLWPGDPYAGAGAVELALELSLAGVDFEALPGLRPEAAGPTLSGIPTWRAGTTALPAGAWEASLTALLAAGRPADTPLALVVNPGRAGQYRMGGSLAELIEVARRSPRQPDAVLVSGPDLGLADRLDTLARRPLHGKRVLVTRPRHQLEPFRAQLAELGAEVVHVPMIEIRPLPAGEAFERAVRLLPQTRLLIFTSANAVDIFFDLLFDVRLDARRLAACQVCAIGSETARSLEGRGVMADLVAGEYTAEGLAEALAGWDLAGTRILVPRARAGRDALPDLLARRGAEVEILAVYETVCPAGAPQALRALFAAGGVDVTTFTSSSTVANFVGALGDEAPRALERGKVACMGPVTADTARKLGLRVDIIAREYTTRGLALAIAEASG